MARHVLLLVLLPACTASIPVHLGKSAQGHEGIDLILDDAGGVLGIPIETVDSSYGAITLGLVEHGGRHGGESLVADGCLRALWVEPDPVFVAHELVHVLGFEGHLECEPGELRLMCDLPRDTDPADVEFTDDELDEIDGELSNLNSCTARGAR